MSEPDPVGSAVPAASTLVKLPQSRGSKGCSTVHVEDGSRWGIEGSRVYVKRQSDYCCRPPWRCFLATPTLLRELRALRAWRALGIRVPEVVAYRQQGTRAELAVMEVCHALELGAAVAQPKADRRAIVVALATALARVHHAGWTHGALASEHILVSMGDGYAITFIDLEKAKRGRRLRKRDLERFWRHNGYLTAAERSLFEAAYEAALS